jgi:hypothetical protein
VHACTPYGPQRGTPSGPRRSCPAAAHGAAQSTVQAAQSLVRPSGQAAVHMQQAKHHDRSQQSSSRARETPTRAPYPYHMRPPSHAPPSRAHSAPKRPRAPPHAGGGSAAATDVRQDEPADAPFEAGRGVRRLLELADRAQVGPPSAQHVVEVKGDHLRAARRPRTRGSCFAAEVAAASFRRAALHRALCTKVHGGPLGFSQLMW